MQNQSIRATNVNFRECDHCTTVVSTTASVGLAQACPNNVTIFYTVYTPPFWYSLHLLNHCYLFQSCHIKTHGSELRGQEEAERYKQVNYLHVAPLKFAGVVNNPPRKLLIWFHWPSTFLLYKINICMYQWWRKLMPSILRTSHCKFCGARFVSMHDKPSVWLQFARY